jgi:nicotinate-nucleotide pyrophosphorylase
LATILVKNMPEDLLKELKRLKVELGCKTWAELLSALVASNEALLLNEEKSEQMRKGVKNFLTLKSTVSRKWTGHPTVLEEARRSRGHETT